MNKPVSIPATLQHKIDLFCNNGHVYRENNELFGEMSWLQVMHGQGLRPKSYHPLVDARSPEEIRAYLADIENVVKKCVEVMPTQEEFIARNCAAAPLL